MSCVQGTIMRITGTIRDPFTREPTDPPDVRATILRADGTSEVLLYSDDEIERLGTGVYRFAIDTSPVAGPWQYELESLGPDASVLRRPLTVTPRLVVP